MVELGQVNICLEVSEILSFVAMIREGHLEQLIHIFAHLKKYHNTKLVFDPIETDVDMSISQRRDWASSEYGHLEENEVPPP